MGEQKYIYERGVSTGSNVGSITVRAIVLVLEGQVSPTKG